LTENTGCLCIAPNATALTMKICLQFVDAVSLQLLFPTNGAMIVDVSGMILIFKIHIIKKNN